MRKLIYIGSAVVILFLSVFAANGGEMPYEVLIFFGMATGIALFPIILNGAIK